MSKNDKLSKYIAIWSRRTSAKPVKPYEPPVAKRRCECVSSDYLCLWCRAQVRETGKL